MLALFVNKVKRTKSRLVARRLQGIEVKGPMRVARILIPNEREAIVSESCLLPLSDPKHKYQRWQAALAKGEAGAGCCWRAVAGAALRPGAASRSAESYRSPGGSGATRAVPCAGLSAGTASPHIRVGSHVIVAALRTTLRLPACPYRLPGLERCAHPIRLRLLPRR